MSRSPMRPLQRKGPRTLVLAGAAMMMGGCSVYYSQYVYAPRPIDVPAAKPGAADAEPAHALVTVVGVRRKDEKSQLPASVEVRLLLENTSPFPVSFDPGTLALVSADLAQFPEPIVAPKGTIAVDPGGTATVEAYFPFPDDRRPDDMDLSGLNVRWTLAVGGHDVTSSAGFVCLPIAYYSRDRYHIGVGYQRYDVY